MESQHDVQQVARLLWAKHFLFLDPAMFPGEDAETSSPVAESPVREELHTTPTSPDAEP